MNPIGSASMYVLVGTSSTGKTSIMNELCKQKENLRLDGVDFRRDPSQPTPADMEKQMINEAIQDVVHGKNVIFDLADAHDLHQELEEKRFNGDVKIILIYCPMDEMCKRMEMRSQGDRQENRIGTVPLDQFAEIYGPAKPGQEVLEIVTRNHAEELYKKYFDMGIEQARYLNQPLPPENVIAEDRERFTQDFLNKLGFTNPLVNQVKIAPKDGQLYHAIVNSKEHTSQKIASMINENQIF